MNIQSQTDDRTSREKAIWIGLVEMVGCRDGQVLGEAEGACCNAIAVAAGLDSFTCRVDAALARMGVKLVNVEDAGCFPDDFPTLGDNAEVLCSAADRARVTGEVQFTTWHVFDVRGFEDQ